MDRRQFIKKGTAAFATFTIIPASVLGGKNYLAPSDHLTKAIIGLGVGLGHINLEGTRVVAICDVAEFILGFYG